MIPIAPFRETFAIGAAPEIDRAEMLPRWFAAHCAELFGGADQDSLTGGAGSDQVFGQDGNDNIFWNPGDGNDLDW